MPKTPTSKSKSRANYDADNLTVLEGLEPVRLRPGMYTDTESPFHILAEVIDNAVDEALDGSCRQIDVYYLEDGGFRVSDNGRGIPPPNAPTDWLERD